MKKHKELVAKLPKYADTGEPFVPGVDPAWVWNAANYPETVELKYEDSDEEWRGTMSDGHPCYTFRSSPDAARDATTPEADSGLPTDGGGSVHSVDGTKAGVHSDDKPDKPPVVDRRGLWRERGGGEARVDVTHGVNPVYVVQGLGSSCNFTWTNRHIWTRSGRVLVGETHSGDLVEFIRPFRPGDDEYDPAKDANDNTDS